MTQPPGLGTPPAEQPDFAPPQAGPYPGQTAPLGWPQVNPESAQPTPGWSPRAPDSAPATQSTGPLPASWSAPVGQAWTPNAPARAGGPAPWNATVGGTQPGSYQGAPPPAWGSPPGETPYGPPTMPPANAGPATGAPFGYPPSGNPAAGAPNSFQQSTGLPGYPTQASAPQGYPGLYPGLPPASSAPKRTRVPLWLPIVGGAVMVVVVGAWALLRPWQDMSPQQPTASSQPSIVRTAPPSASANPAPVSGGDLGKPVTLTSRTGSATATVTSATWTDAGDLPPEPGTSYLILDVSYRGVQGAIPVGRLWTSVVDSEGNAHLMTLAGPALERPLPGVVTAGETVAGQLGFALARGPVTVQFLDESLQPVATVTLPG